MITKQDLLEWLKQVDAKLHQKMTIIAVGGTATTLLGLKESTRDVDFCLDAKDASEFKKLARSDIFVVDVFKDGFIFALQLPEDYRERAAMHENAFTHLDHSQLPRDTAPLQEHK